MAVLYSDNFDTDTVGSLPSGWTNAAGTWAVAANGSVSSPNALANTSGANGNAVLYTAGASTADGTVTFTTRYNGAVSPGLLFRFDAGYQNGYFIGFSANSVSFYKRVSGSFSSIGNAIGFTFTANTNDVVAQEARFVGSTLEYRLWNITAGQTRPSAASASVTDSTKTTAGYCGIYAGASGTPPIDDFSISGTAPSGTTIAPNDSNIIYSPGNWTPPSSTSAKTINAGAYFRTMLAGLTSATLTFDTSNLGSPASQIYYRINGYEAQSPWIKAPVAASVPITLPTDMASAPYALLEVLVKSTSETITRWSSNPATEVVFTGIICNSGTTTLAPVVAANDVIFFTDSIGEGVRTVNQTAANDTDRNDALMGWPRELAKSVGCEFGVIGFGATGWTVGGSGGVPALPSSYNLIKPGVTRTFAREPIAILVNMGTNDSGASASSVTSAVQTFLNGILGMTSTASVVLLRPFNGSQDAAIVTGITAVGSARVYHVDTTGVFNTAYGADSLNLHPNGPNNLAFIAPALRPLIEQYCRARRFTVVSS